MTGLLSFVISLLAVSDHTVGDASLLPSAETLNGWKLAGPARVFSGSGLYGHIDGGAEIFFEFGFEELTVQRYANGAHTVEVELYRMTDSVAALGIYLLRCGNRCEAQGTLQGFPSHTTRGRAQLMFAEDRFLAVITVNKTDGQGGAALPAFASEVTRHLPPDRPPELGASLPTGWAAGSLRLIRGPLALQAIITLGEGDVLQLGGRLTAVAADYPPARGRPAHTLILVEYPNEEAAGAALAHLGNGLDPEVKIMRKSSGSFIFRDYVGKFGLAVATGRRLALRLNLESDPQPER